MMMIGEEEEEPMEIEPKETPTSATKRKLKEVAVPAKKRRLNSDDVVCLETEDDGNGATV